MGRILPFIFAILAMLAPLGLATPANAQSARDFSLPPSSQPQEPEAQGPADDTGLVPVGPRVIQDDDTSEPPAPVEDQAITADEEPTPRATTAETPANQPAPPPAAAAPETRAPEQAARTIQPPTASAETAQEPDNEAQQPVGADPIILPPLIAPEMQNEQMAEAGEYPGWLWFAGGGIVFLICAIAGWLFWRRAKVQQVPQIERPIVAADAQGEPANLKVDLNVEVIGLTRSLMNLTLACRVTAANRSGRAIRDIEICADLASAHRNLPLNQQLAMADIKLPQLATINRIGPHQSQYVKLDLQIPVANLNAFRQGEAVLCVPLLRLRIDAPTIETATSNFAIGLSDGGIMARLQPIPLHIPPGSYPAARARLLE